MMIRSKKIGGHTINLIGKGNKFTLTNRYKVGNVTHIMPRIYTDLETAILCFNIHVETAEFFENMDLDA